MLNEVKEEQKHLCLYLLPQDSFPASVQDTLVNCPKFVTSSVLLAVNLPCTFASTSAVWERRFKRVFFMWQSGSDLMNAFCWVLWSTYYTANYLHNLPQWSITFNSSYLGDEVGFECHLLGMLCHFETATASLQPYFIPLLLLLPQGGNHRNQRLWFSAQRKGDGASKPLNRPLVKKQMVLCC